MVENSRINMTGKNALLALLIASIITFVLIMIYAAMATFINLNTQKDIDFMKIINFLLSFSGSMFLPIFTIFAPIIFILTFALLQRFRIKY